MMQDALGKALTKRGGEPSDDDLQRAGRYAIEAVCLEQLQLTLGGWY